MTWLQRTSLTRLLYNRLQGIHCALSAKLKLKHRASKTNNSNLRGVLVNRVFSVLKDDEVLIL